MHLERKTREELWEMYHDFVNGKDGKTLEILIPNYFFEFINDLDISGPHKAFAFTTWVFSKFAMLVNRPHPIYKLKELWGYSKDAKSLDYITKKGGLLDQLFLTETVIEGLSEEQRVLLGETSNKIQYKKPLDDVDTSKGFFFRVFAEPMLACMINSQELGAIAFYIYSFICYRAQFQARYSKSLYEMTPLSTSYIAKGLGLSEGTVKRFKKSLIKYGLVMSYNSQIEIKTTYTMDDANKLLPKRECSGCFPEISKQKLISPASIPNVIHDSRHKGKQEKIKPFDRPKPNEKPVLSRDEEMAIDKFLEEKRLARNSKK
jgi:hypothetical protein